LSVEPNKLWIDGRAWLWAMDMPQFKPNETDISADPERHESDESTRGRLADLIR
jgi:hypothetical protein